MVYADLHQYLQALEDRDLLRRIRVEVDPEWEIAAVSRVAFRRFPPDTRPALLFEKVKGKEMPVVVGAVGASSAVYATALGISPDNPLQEVSELWARAIDNPLPTVRVESGPCKDVILGQEELDIFRLPHPMWTPEHDPGYFITAPLVITKDPETGAQNVGTYRMQLRERAKTSIQIGSSHHGMRHVRKHEALGMDTPVAVVIGADPTVALVSATSIPFGVEELAVAGALRGAPLEVVRCETVDLEVPATAEIVIEGVIPAGVRQDEGPFGEHPGYMGNPVEDQPVVRIQCMTHRKDAIYQAFLSQKPPSESSRLRSIGRESSIYSHLKKYLGMDVVDVHLRESGGASHYLIISLRNPKPGEAWEAVWGAWSLLPNYCKFTIVVDEDINIRDPFEVEWAMSFRVTPDKDIHIVRNVPALGSDPSVAPWGVPKNQRKISSKVLIDATKKHLFPPEALPSKKHLQLVEQDWERYGLSMGHMG